MDRLAGFVAALLLASGLASGQTAKPAGPAAPPANAPSSWSASTTPQSPPQPAADSTLSLSVYSDLNTKNLPPYQSGPRRRDDPAYAVDVSAVMAHCPDGSLLITGLVIGGQLTPLDNRCPSGAARAPAIPAPPCDANRWNCATAPPD